MRVLVTGAAGFIGERLVHDRLARGDHVVALDLHARAWPEGVESHAGDLGDTRVVAEAIRGAEIVFHLAAAHLDQSTPAEEYRRVNVEATRRLVQLAHDAGVRRFVHCSTVGVYGDVTDPPADEDDPKRPGNTYEVTKLEGETAALREAHERGLDILVLRPAWVYGATCPRTRRLLRMIARGRFFYFGGGANLRHPVHIDDMLEAFDLATHAGPSGAVYNIAGPGALPLREMIALMARSLGSPPPRVTVPYWIGWTAALASECTFAILPGQPPLTRRSLAFFRNTNAYATKRAAEGLGFVAVTEIGPGMQRVVDEIGGREALLA